MRASKLVILSGVSGSGKSTALNAFADFGFFCVDNLPGPMVRNYVDFLLDLPPDWHKRVNAPAEGVDDCEFALLLDCRDEESVGEVLSALKRLRDASVQVDLLYFDCRDDVILRRFQETRRPHPFLIHGGRKVSLRDALTIEREITSRFRESADRIIDTSAFSPHELRALVQDLVGEKVLLEVAMTSFGFKFGPPKDADIVMDVRFLPNPHFVPELRDSTGLETPVRDYVLKSPDAHEFLAHFEKLLEFLIPRYEKEGKRYLNVALGCTGGKHRSVAVTEELFRRLKIEGAT
ncbi:MAG: RNase adapter RapZ, partial [Deltaproteobacteria bacterium]|nr:RNase adapter RapZ [Deltaproteobacteria bacterium]